MNIMFKKKKEIQTFFEAAKASLKVTFAVREMNNKFYLLMF